MLGKWRTFDAVAVAATEAVRGVGRLGSAAYLGMLATGWRSPDGVRLGFAVSFLQSGVSADYMVQLAP